MNVHERLRDADLQRRRSARHRETLRERGLVQQSVWLPKELTAAMDERIAGGRFENRSEAIAEALKTLFEEKQMT